MTVPRRCAHAEELKADLTLDQLKQLVGLVEYDASSDPFPVTAMDAVVFVVGNATQTAHFYQLALGHGPGRLRRPRDRQPRPQVATCCARARPGSCSTAASTPDSPLLDHHRRHGDGVVDLALEVPDVDKCIEHARSAGATDPRRAARRHRRARHRPDGRHRDVRRDPAHAGRPLAATTAPTCPATSRADDHGDPPRGPPEAAVPGRRPLRRQRRARPDGRVGRRSTTR